MAPACSHCEELRPYSGSEETQIPEDPRQAQDKGFYTGVWPDVLTLLHTGRQAGPETFPIPPSLPVMLTMMSLSVEEPRAGPGDLAVCRFTCSENLGG